MLFSLFQKLIILLKNYKPLPLLVKYSFMNGYKRHYIFYESLCEKACPYANVNCACSLCKCIDYIQLTSGISTSFISNNLLSRSENLVPVFTGKSNKILWKRGDIAPKEQFLPFPTIFSIKLYLQVSKLHFVCEIWLFDLFFLNFASPICQGTDFLEVF